MNHYDIFLAEEAKNDLHQLEKNPGLKKRLKAVNKALAYLQSNPRHPGLNTHKYSELKGPRGEEVFEAYAENNTPGAYRVLWYYGPSKKQITVFSIIPHP